MLNLWQSTIKDEHLEAEYEQHRLVRGANCAPPFAITIFVVIFVFTGVEIIRFGFTPVVMTRLVQLIPLGLIPLCALNRPESYIRHHDAAMTLLAIVAIGSNITGLAYLSSGEFATQWGILIITLFGIFGLLRLPLLNTICVAIGATISTGIVADRVVMMGRPETVYIVSVLFVASLMGALLAWLLEREAQIGFLLNHDLQDQLKRTEAIARDLNEEARKHRATTSQLEQSRSRAEKASHAKSDFVGAVSHELRTPLNGIVASIDLLETTNLDEEQKAVHSILAGGATKLTMLINDLLDLTRIETGTMKVEATPNNLRSLIEQVAMLHRHAMAGAGLSFDVSIDPHIPAWVKLDPHRVAQVLNNLLENARRYTPEGSVILEVIAQANQIVFSVIDTGRGLPDNPDQLFDKYHRQANDGDGLGLGLNICAHLTQAMGGHISAHNHALGGAEFRVALPLISAKAEPPPLPSKRAAIPVGSRVLLVEDHPTNRRVVRMSLERLGCLVFEAADGEDALSWLDDNLVDLVLLDCELPGISGFDTARRIRAKERSEVDSDERTTVVALTAHATPGAKEQCLAAGMDDFLTKPFRREDLQKVLERWITPAQVKQRNQRSA